MEKEREESYVREVDAIHQHASQQINAQAKVEALRNYEALEINKELSRLKAQREAATKQAEVERERAETYHVLNSPMLRGDGKGVRSQDNYKGMSAQQKLAVFMAQENQRKELAARREAEKEEERKWALYERDLCSRFDDLEKQQIAEREYKAFKHAHSLKMQAEEDKARASIIKGGLL